MEDTFFDYVVLGTGLQQCIASSELSNKNKKVLQIDKETTYGSDLRTLNYLDLVALTNKTPKKELINLSNKFNIDITPKFLLASAKMVSLLMKNKMQDLIDFTVVSGNFMYHQNLHLIPSSEASSLKSNLIGWMQKPYVMKFFWNVPKYGEEMHKNPNAKFDYKKTMREEFKSFGLNEKSIAVIGHAIALNLDESYLDRSPKETYDSICEYVKSLGMLEEDSPFLYPHYGLSEFCQAFSRRAGLAGCTFMLNTPVIAIYDKNGKCIETSKEKGTNNEVSDKKETIDFTENNKASIIESVENLNIEDRIDGHESAKYKIVIQDNVNNCKRNIYANCIVSDPSYFENCTKKQYEILTKILIVKGDIKLLPQKHRNKANHITFLGKELSRKNDVFVAILGHTENVCPEGYQIVIINTVKEDENDQVNMVKIKELLDFDDLMDEFTINKEFRGKCVDDSDLIICDSVDQTTHFETLYDNSMKVLKLLDDVSKNDIL